MSRTGAKEPQKNSSDEVQTGIEHIYIGVFFDGTNNNMVQMARFNGTNVVTKVSNVTKKVFWYVADKTPWHDEEELNADLYEEYKTNNIEGGYTTQSKGTKKYSNIAVLHDNYQLTRDRDDEKRRFKHFYIEGSGATDTSQMIPGNPNGLGFGLGDTGVTALVSKAVKYVTRYVKGLEVDKDIVTLHFYAFGFSRGATCARLFTHLINRDDGQTIVRESEFGEHYASDCYNNGCLHFLADFKNKKVEMMGIYDTVVSIGYLMQIDGQVHPTLRKMVHGLAQNYKNNWHYKNVHEYGLYLSDSIAQKTRHICHICAMDEYRENFALTTVGKDVPKNAVEILIPGCHSDVGGGYLNEEEEQEFVLTKNRKHNWPDDKATVVKDVSTFIDYECPATKIKMNNDNKMGIHSLAKMGWIDPYWEYSKEDRKRLKQTQYFNGKKNVVFTLRAKEDEEEVKFKRNSGNGKGVYSNIPLKMMISFVNTKATDASDKDAFPDILFNSEVTYYEIPSDLKEMGNQMVSHATKATEGQRIWIYPDQSLSNISNVYKKLRMQHLHFTCSSEIYHLNNPFARNVSTLEGSAGNLGNTPNFDLEGRLCRIVYYGDDSSDLSPQKDIHYIYDLSRDIVLPDATNKSRL